MNKFRNVSQVPNVEFFVKFAAPKDLAFSKIIGLVPMGAFAKVESTVRERSKGCSLLYRNVCQLKLTSQGRRVFMSL